MCYAGCRYELTWGEGAGECSLPNGEKPPIDAMCEINDLHAENAILRELMRELMPTVRIAARHGINVGKLADQERRMCELGIEVDE